MLVTRAMENGMAFPLSPPFHNSYRERKDCEGDRRALQMLCTQLRRLSESGPAISILKSYRFILLMRCHKQ